jgi:glycosyltransferase involved in cell wall biosynthesis
VHNSLVGSLTKTSAIKLHRFIGSIERIDAFISPTKFTIQKYIDAGFDEKKMYHVPTFINYKKISHQKTDQNYILYFGRMVAEKGVRVLLEGYKQLKGPKPKLMVIGDIDVDEYAKETVDLYKGFAQFKNFMEKKELYRYIGQCSFVVIPSTSYDNMPNVLLEAFAHAKAVIASGHGCFPEIIQEKRTGLLFNAGDPISLRKKLDWAINHRVEMREMGTRARAYVENHHSPERHYEKLMDIFRIMVNAYPKSKGGIC